MTTTADRLRTYWGERQFDRERVSVLVARYWEVALFAAIVSLALALRLWDLAGRAVHHDESIHNWYSWLLAEGRGYHHDPTYHGPLKVVLTAGIFKVLGASDTTARLLYALAGTILVALPFFFRQYIGRAGALIASGLLAVSPVILYVSRFSRDDILIVTYTLAMAIVIWRYLKEQREGYLYVVPVLLMLGFTTMEVNFITTAIFLVFLEYLLANDFVDQMRASRSMTTQDVVVAYAIFLPTAWLIAALWPLIEGQRKRWSLSTLPPAGHLIVLMGTFSLPQFSAAIQKLPEYVGKVPGIGDNLVNGLQLDALADQGFRSPDEANLMHVTVILTLIASAYIGLLWNARVWAIGAVLFFVPYVLLFTTGFTNPGGFWSGIWGQLDYWLQQQFERRGNQPDYYYFMQLPIYEFLPLIFALGGTLYYAFKGKLEQQLLSGAALLLILAISLGAGDIPLIGSFHVHLCFLIAIGTVLLLPIEGLTKFLLFWTLSIFFAVTVAGEKMPWLTVHVALPLILLAAKIMDDLLSSIALPQKAAEAEPEPAPTRQRGRRRAARPEAPPAVSWERIAQYAPFLYAAGLAFVATIFFVRFGPGSAFSVFPWFFSAAATGVVLWVAASTSWRLAGQVAAIALFGSLLVFSVRASTIASYDQGDPDGTPPELLIYAQGGPELGTLNDDIVQFARETGRGKDLRIILDQSNETNIWPWPWYLRDYNVGYENFTGEFAPEPASVLLINSANRSKVEPYASQVERSEDYTHMWWFPENYRGLSVGGFLSDFFKGHYFPIWRAYFIDREVPNVTPTNDRVAYFFRDFSPNEAQPAQALDPASQTVLGSAGSAAGEFSQPADVAVDDQGNLYVVDTLNRRIQRLDAGGEATVLGEAGNAPGEFGAIDDPPDGPWGIGVDQQGNIYVADTWNHRIQKFGPDLQFIQEWGQQISPEHYGSGEADPFELFGPRDVTVDNDGNVLVVDTGDKRIVKYSPDGEFIQAYGQSGSGPGQFNEPSSIAVALNGDIFVADYWNQRIQHFDAQFRYQDEIKVGVWGSTGITDRAYIAVLGDGRILATDPGNEHVLVIETSGEFRSWRLIEGASKPLGIAVDGAGQVYISDALTSEVRRLPLTVLLAPPPTEAAPSPTATAAP